MVVTVIRYDPVPADGIVDRLVASCTRPAAAMMVSERLATLADGALVMLRAGEPVTETRDRARRSTAQSGAVAVLYIHHARSGVDVHLYPIAIVWFL